MQLVITISSKGFCPSFNIGFGVFLVNGSNLEPEPPAIITTLGSLPAEDLSRSFSVIKSITFLSSFRTGICFISMLNHK